MFRYKKFVIYMSSDAAPAHRCECVFLSVYLPSLPQFQALPYKSFKKRSISYNINVTGLLFHLLYCPSVCACVCPNKFLMSRTGHLVWVSVCGNGKFAPRTTMCLERIVGICGEMETDGGVKRGKNTPTRGALI